jgi:hypothetical protein
MTIKLITFKTNQTLVGSVIENDDFETVTIREPVQVIVVPPRSQTDQGGIAFSPYLEYSKEFKTGIRLNKIDILCINTPIVELENQYNQIFGSGIQIASKLV